MVSEKFYYSSNSATRKQHFKISWDNIMNIKVKSDDFRRSVTVKVLSLSSLNDSKMKVTFRNLVASFISLPLK